MWLKRKFFCDFLNFQLSSLGKIQKNPDLEENFVHQRYISALYCWQHSGRVGLSAARLQGYGWNIVGFLFIYFRNVASAALGIHLTRQPNSLSMLLTELVREMEEMFDSKRLFVCSCGTGRPWQSFQITLILPVYSSECHRAPLPD